MNVETCLDYKKNLKNLDCSIIYDFVHFKAKQHCLLIIIGQFSIEIYSEGAFFFILLPILKTLSCSSNVFTKSIFYRLIIFRTSVCSPFHQKIWLIFLHSSTFMHEKVNHGNLANYTRYEFGFFQNLFKKAKFVEPLWRAEWKNNQPESVITRIIYMS